MHETSLARQLLAAVLARAKAEGACRVRRVQGRLAETETLSRASLAWHFAAHARGTVAEGAHLELELVHVGARCPACGASFAPEHHLLVCPSCGAADAELEGETGLRIDSMDVE